MFMTMMEEKVFWEVKEDEAWEREHADDKEELETASPGAQN